VLLSLVDVAIWKMETVWALTGRPSCEFDRSNLTYIGSQRFYREVKVRSQALNERDGFSNLMVECTTRSWLGR